VADGAVVVELSQAVVGFRRLIEIRLVTGITGCRCPGVLSGVAGDTVHLQVGTGQWKRCRGVIIVGWLPAADSMAQGTVMRETARLVVWRSRGGKIGAVTRIAVCRCPRVTGQVTCLASDTVVSTA
jgi:hypothetical protein